MAIVKEMVASRVKGFISLALGLLFLITLLSLNFAHPDRNLLGIIGHVVAFSFTYVFGLGSYPIAFFLIHKGIKLIKNQKDSYSAFHTFCFATLLISLCIILNLLAEGFTGFASLFQKKVCLDARLCYNPQPFAFVRYYLGGVPLYYLLTDIPFVNLKSLLGLSGTAIIFSATFLVSLVCLLDLDKLMDRAKKIFLLLKSLLKTEKKEAAPIPVPQPKMEFKKIIEKLISKKEPLKQPIAKEAPLKKEILKPIDASYVPPPLSFLSNPPPVDHPFLKKELKKQSAVLEETLKSFGIEAKVGEINCGPTITSFEVHPSVGVKVQKIKTLSNDIALNLQAKSMRIIAPIPGKAAVGVEIPSLYPQEVSLKEMLIHYQHSGKRLNIPLLLGKAVTGEHIMADLTRMPHCLIAGATGSGKSVCINTIVISILMNSSPSELKLLMIDPKKVELTQYSALPHMIAPVITEAKDAYAALHWLVREMKMRYEILKHSGMRNISSFNTRKISASEKEAPIAIPEKMPFIVAIVDEFADLMMVSGADLETPIARIAQMARAVGIHLILATQRPSREVITGIIKANFPSRIAFKVASRINSQIILDEIGAESLLGNGDLLFQPPGTATLLRAQGSFIKDEDINRVISYLCDRYPTNYLISSFDSIDPHPLPDNDDENGPKDSLYDQALSLVLQTKNASTTFLQRKLKIGYARAASLIDELEENKVIGPPDGSRPRQILKNFDDIFSDKD